MAIFGIATADQAYVDVTIEGLDPPPQDRSYVLWLMLNKKDGYPLSPLAVNPQATSRIASRSRPRCSRSSPA